MKQTLFKEEYNGHLPFSTDPLSEYIKGLRLQPIVRLRDGQKVAWEVLSQVNKINPETLFKDLSPELKASFLIWKIELLVGKKELYWLNTPVDVLQESFLIRKILACGNHGNIAIELQDPENLAGLKKSNAEQVKNNINMLMAHGWNIILDDLQESLVDILLSQGIKFSGVKIDRHELHGARDLSGLIKKAEQIGDFVVIEGIEDNSDLARAKKTEASLGQGYLWPEIAVPVKIPHSIYLRAYKWFTERDA